MFKKYRKDKHYSNITGYRNPLGCFKDIFRDKHYSNITGYRNGL